MPTNGLTIFLVCYSLTLMALLGLTLYAFNQLIRDYKAMDALYGKAIERSIEKSIRIQELQAEISGKDKAISNLWDSIVTMESEIKFHMKESTDGD